MKKLFMSLLFGALIVVGLVSAFSWSNPGVGRATPVPRFALPSWMPVPFDGTLATCKLGLLGTTWNNVSICYNPHLHVKGTIVVIRNHNETVFVNVTNGTAYNGGKDNSTIMVPIRI